MYRVIRWALASACGLMLAACAASDFAAPVSAFSDATTAASTSFRSSRESVVKFANERRLKILSDGGKLGAEGDDCTIGGKHCRLIVIDKTGKKQPLINSLDNLQALMDGLNAYTKGLADIVKADTSGEVTKATEAIKSNLTSLAQDGDALAKQNGVRDVNFAKVSPFIAPVGDAVNFVATRALEAQKVAALRVATSEMEEMFPSLTKVFNAVNVAAMRLQRGQIDAAFRKARDDYQRNRTDANRDAYIRAAAAYDAALNSDPKSMFDALREAHGVLAQSLKGSNPNFSELWTLLQKATDEAAKLAEITKAFQKASATAAKQS